MDFQLNNQLEIIRSPAADSFFDIMDNAPSGSKFFQFFLWAYLCGPRDLLPENPNDICEMEPHEELRALDQITGELALPKIDPKLRADASFCRGITCETCPFHHRAVDPGQRFRFFADRYQIPVINIL
ncbi:hypothetical protein DV711_06230 [Motiliproteus coralliicola]|uniref:Uncharacterized protein n=1 Tax=Motiliproteus coralliicola TaxID=2283196 RepID=A0A369WSS9_9GAMM|nr:hypothetical protein [Motiliproteus coralliicola]RDE25150.1 hypothetical protein DV711_06230 [Motiliproteus coralliicola]